MSALVPMRAIESALRAAHAAPSPVRVSPVVRERPKMWLRFRVTRAFTDVTLTVLVGRGMWQSITVRVDNAMVQRVLEKRGVSLEVGFSLGGIWKAVKSVAKATGVSKVLSIAKGVLKNPIVTTIFPVASIAARAVEAGGALLDAATKAKSGKPADKAAAKALVANAQRLASQGDPAAQAGLQLASRAYRIVVNPL